ncbi:hypothetical protein J7J00_05365 [Bacillus sp. ISL-4]|uniref:hypothetical protein n=1 Tax=Bacillus sp. ISL-4 TaxID=2819125 RepID=UPI001BEBE83E|nr:hypothetical protein [Bacillus sp. ISL-4]MBT2664916.1 hypothetical protein [Bacillus sp. ISL-4]MBT2672209.1 hypothetical protein [Streptomyces sp. ISL-14]
MIEEITAVSQQTTASSNELAQYTQQLTQLINDLEDTLGGIPDKELEELKT